MVAWTPSVVFRMGEGLGESVWGLKLPSHHLARRRGRWLVVRFFPRFSTRCELTARYFYGNVENLIFTFIVYSRPGCGASGAPLDPLGRWGRGGLGGTARSSSLSSPRHSGPAMAAGLRGPRPRQRRIDGEGDSQAPPISKLPRSGQRNKHTQATATSHRARGVTAET